MGRRGNIDDDLLEYRVSGCMSHNLLLNVDTIYQLCIINK